MTKRRQGKMWLSNRSFAYPAQQIAFQTYLTALRRSQQRTERAEIGHFKSR
jgi:hypothetical protein